MTPKISLVIPCYNVEKYIEQCLNSAREQTLEEIEIICVNDGSTDGTLAFLQQAAAHDARIIIIDKPNEGYGATMNKGFARARGEYIGILESDDFMEPTMLEDFYKIAKTYDVEVVKSNFYYYWSTPVERDEFSNLIAKEQCGKVIEPLDYEALFDIKPSIWSAIYKTDFIRKNHITFNETPGASFQDASFNFQVWLYATRIFLIYDAYLHYRQDNEASSVNSNSKIYCVCDEYVKMEEALAAYPDREKAKSVHDILVYMKYNSYMWNYDRLSEDARREFIQRFSEEFREHDRRGEINLDRLEYWKHKDLALILDEPLFFHELRYDGPKKGKINTVKRFVRAGGLPYFKRLVKMKLGKED